MRGTPTMLDIAVNLDSRLAASQAPQRRSPGYSDSLVRIARLTASALSVPLISVALLDEMCQWFGADMPVYGGYGSLCEPRPLVGRSVSIPDATLDIRSATHPLVTGRPYIRSLLSTVIRDIDGTVLGTLDAMALQPRQFTDADIAAAADFADILGEVLRGRESKDSDRGSSLAIANRVPAMIGYWNRNVCCEFANDRYRDWFGMEPRSIMGLSMRELVGEATYQLNEPHIRQALAGFEQRFERSLTKLDGSSHILDVRYIPDVDAIFGVRGFFVLATEITELHDAYDRIRALAQRLECVYEDERRTLSNVLHESVAQDLYAARLRLGNVESCSKSKAEALRGCHEVGLAIETCIVGMRQIANDIWPAGFSHHGITTILRHHAEHYADLTGLTIHVLENGPFPALDEATQLIFFRAAQELLKNVVSHAKARNVTIAFKADPAQIAMEVLDDGVGMAEGSVAKFGSFGLLEIRERIAVLGGALDVERNLPRGTKVTVHIPNLRAQAR
jgi:signal transduction histidine kinase